MRISIHALREEGDAAAAIMHALALDFYPRPPRGGRRHQLQEYLGLCQFLSTPSARRATRCWYGLYPATAISIHALREEGDGIPGQCCRHLPGFLSTPSARRATANVTVK